MERVQGANSRSNATASTSKKRSFALTVEPIPLTRLVRKSGEAVPPNAVKVRSTQDEQVTALMGTAPRATSPKYPKLPPFDASNSAATSFSSMIGTSSAVFSTVYRSANTSFNSVSTHAPSEPETKSAREVDFTFPGDTDTSSHGIKRSHFQTLHRSTYRDPKQLMDATDINYDKEDLSLNGGQYGRQSLVKNAQPRFEIVLPTTNMVHADPEKPHLSQDLLEKLVAQSPFRECSHLINKIRP